MDNKSLYISIKTMSEKKDALDLKIRLDDMFVFFLRVPSYISMVLDSQHWKVLHKSSSKYGKGHHGKKLTYSRTSKNKHP